MKVIIVPTDRIVILGSNGVIGKDLVNYLSSCGKSFFELDRSKIDLLLSTSPNKIRSCLRPGDSIVVLAGITPSREKGYRALANNIKMMENVCLAINDSDISHVVYASSDAVYKTQTPKITEHSETHCSSDYSTMHLVREKMLMNAVTCSLSVLRITQVFSPQDSHNAYGPCRFIRAAKRNQSIQLYGDGADIRDHINVRDVSRAIACSVDKRIDGIINVASGNAVSFSYIADLVKQCAAPSIEVVSIPRKIKKTKRVFDNARLLQCLCQDQMRAIEEEIPRLWKAF